MGRESFVLYKSFYEAIGGLEDNVRLELYEAIMRYGFDDIEPKGMGAVSSSIFLLIKPNIDSAVKRYEARVSNGKKGGRKKKAENNQDETEDEADGKLNVDVDYNLDLDLNGDVDGEIAPTHTAEKTYGEFQKVKMTDEEYEKLVQHLSKDEIQEYISRLDMWLAEGHEKTNHCATILNWRRKDLSNMQKKKQYPFYQGFVSETPSLTPADLMVTHPVPEYSRKVR